MQSKKLIWRRSILLPFKHNRACKLVPKASVADSREQPDPQPLCSEILELLKGPILPPSPVPFAEQGSGSSGCLRVPVQSSADSGSEPSVQQWGFVRQPSSVLPPGGLQLSPNTDKWFLNTCSVTVSMAAVPGFCSVVLNSSDYYEQKGIAAHWNLKTVESYWNQCPLIKMPL